MYSLKTRQICLFFIAFLPAVTVFFYPSIVAGEANEDCWLSALFGLILDSVTLILLLFAVKRAKKLFPDKNYFEMLKEGFGKTGEKIILSFYFLFFLLKSVIPIIEQKNYIELTLYETIPYFYIFIPFFVAGIYLCTKKLRILGRLSDIMFIATLSGLILLVALSIFNVDFSAILPIGANGINKIATGTYKSANWFSNAAYFIFFIGEFDFKKNDGIKIFLSFIFAELITVFITVCFYGIFTYTAYRQNFALTEIAKFSTVINNIGRFDYIGICLLLFSNTVSIALPIYFACLVLNRLTNAKNPIIISIIVNAIIVSVVFMTEKITFGLTGFILDYGSLLFLTVGNLLPIITAFPKSKGAFFYEKV